MRIFREKQTIDEYPINAGFMVLQPEIFNYLDRYSCVFEGTPIERIAEEG